MRTLFRIAVATVLAAVTAGVVVPPPAWSHSSVCLGTGVMQTAPHGYPVLYSPAVSGFSVRIGYPDAGGCVNSSGSFSGPATMWGVLTGFCGHWTGSGTMMDTADNHDVILMLVGSTVIVAGFDRSTAGLMNVVPIPNAGGGPNSCVQGNAHTFHVTAAVVNV